MKQNEKAVPLSAQKAMELAKSSQSKHSELYFGGVMNTIYSAIKFEAEACHGLDFTYPESELYAKRIITKSGKQTLMGLAVENDLRQNGYDVKFEKTRKGVAMTVGFDEVMN